ncbi:hypothetical protein [Halobacillus sp. Cin3]|uniref:hypothetical protein n=1 Tax=Halobacillus sp. Cin3 TaxID=2928441 RepID=UPI00248E2B28|nr:hypothetical protein [Halobacillus sp. Cin3]
MKAVRFSGHELEVDYDETLAYYKHLPQIGEKDHCDCTYCKNYVLATNTFPMSVKALFQDMGVNREKGAEVSHFYEAENRKHMYVADYRLSGKLLKSPAVKTTNIYYKNNDDYFTIGFENVDALEKGAGMVSFYIEAFLPWLLDIESE